MSTLFSERDLNLELIALIQSFPCLWDTRHPGYRNFRSNEPVWEQIALCMKQGLTVADLKARWRKLRIAYCGYLRSNRTNYLSINMEFLRPFVDIVLPPKQIDSKDVVFDDVPLKEPIVISGQDDAGSNSGDCKLAEEVPVEYGRPCDENGGYSSRYISVDPQNEDAMFLLSVLPNMRQMTADQKKRFKVGLLKASDQILKPS